MSDRLTKEGIGWRLGWNSHGSDYYGLLAGSSWAIELTKAEFYTFQKLAMEVDATMQAIACELMDDERIACEAEADHLWLEADGFPEAYSVRFILKSSRRCEGEWGVEASQQILQALFQIVVF